MEIGCQFEDDFFEEPKTRIITKSKSYEAKVFTPFWFMDSIVDEKASEEAIVILKHQADFYYQSKNYSKAAEAYDRCLKLVPPSNNTWKREFLENLARSFLKLDEPEKALEWSLKLDESCINDDQKIISMNLLALVCHQLGKFKEELEALHYCMYTHKSYPDYWLRLGLCYAGLFKINLPDYPLPKIVEKQKEESQSCCAFNSKPCVPGLLETQESCVASTNLVSPEESANSKDEIVENGACSDSPKHAAVTSKCDVCTLGIQIVSSCLIRCETLIDSGGSNRLGVERDEQTKKKIASSLKHMEVDESFIEIASQMLGTDFFPLQETCDTTLKAQANFTSKQNTTDTTDS